MLNKAKKEADSVKEPRAYLQTDFIDVFRHRIHSSNLDMKRRYHSPLVVEPFHCFEHLKVNNLLSKAALERAKLVAVNQT